MSERPPFASVGLVSGAALAYEILLTRHFAIVHWHHFAYLMISLALVGFGASGTFLVLARRWLEPRFERSYVASLAAFGVLAVAAPVATRAMPFQVEQLLWDPWQPAWLAATFLTLALPFFCVASAIGLALLNWPSRAGRVYGADLAGAGLGSVAVLALLYVLPVEGAIKLVGCTGLAAALVALLERRSRDRRAAIAAALALAIVASVPGVWLRPEPGPYKALSQALRVEGTRVMAERSSPLGRIDVLESPRVPLRHAPGSSLMAAGEPPAQLGLFTDGDGMDVITRASADPARHGYLLESTAALPYRIATPRSVFVASTGGGVEILRALQGGAARVDAVERNRQVVELLRADFRNYTGDLAGRAGVRLEVADARGALAGSSERYDLIVLPLDGGVGGGLGGLNEDYLHTVEAFGLYLARLAPGGALSVTRYTQVPPRDALKLYATAVAALEAAGVAAPGRQLAMIRGWQTVTLLVRNGEFSGGDLERVRAFCTAMGFDIAWFPGTTPPPTVVHNQLARPWFDEGARALLGTDRERFLADYPFDIRPATDDRPFVRNFFRWSTFASAWQARDRGGMALLEAGYPVVVAALLVALLAGAVLILVPLTRLQRGERRTAGTGRAFVYFACIGLAFLFIELAFLQKLLRLVHHPTVALALTLATFLLAAGAGSLATARVPSESAWRRHRWVVAGLGVLGLACSFAFDPLAARVEHWPLVPKVALAVTLLAPLAFLMGTPFPLALRALPAPLVPWAWGINGCASVVSPMLATLLAVRVGFTAVVWLALALYALTLAAFPRGAPGTD